MSTPPTTPAGWYADPQVPSRWRWWDGAKWTENVSGGDPGVLMTSADYLVVRASARLGRWSATVHDRTLAQVGRVTMRGYQMRLLGAGDVPVLELDASSTRFSWDSADRGGLRRWTLRDAAARQLGEMAVTKYFNRRITLTLRDAAGQDVGTLAPIGKVDHDFSIVDAAGTAVGRVWRAEREGGLLEEDETWAAQIVRPLPAPLDSLVLGAVCTLDSVQHVVMNARSSRRSSF
ncbi:MAG TPA: DUF2510 domain-containing protein [Solirubrobacteraceae bacterium]|nr:DUF2510 domain-containing protein [Solirubrobacteraceae bacterium]